jgi:uncharacterized protein (DUF952 family)
MHGTPAAVWEATPPDADYVPAGFDKEGFIHTTIGRVAATASLNRYYRDDPRPYVALVIDLDRVHAPWEITRYPGRRDEYPHIFGPLNRDAIVLVLPVPREADGRFLPPRRR